MVVGYVISKEWGFVMVVGYVITKEWGFDNKVPQDFL